MIENMWDKFGVERLKGITVYQVARKMGAAKKLAKLVEKHWDGPEKF